MIFQLLFYLNHIDQNPELKSNNINPELLLRGSSPNPEVTVFYTISSIVNIKKVYSN